ncbi:MAG: Type 1 glutamine amidotransferase-like domain-containing protein [Candidatus Nanoarchaeia archaeon]
MTNKICLLSGHTSEGDLISIDKTIIAELENKNVIVLNLAASRESKLKKREEFFRHYFDFVGASSIKFISEKTPYESIKECFNSAGLIYLPGGHTDTLIDNLQKINLVPLLSSFNGTLEGNNAGAYALCPEYLRVRSEKSEIFPATNIINFWVKTCYDPMFDSALRELSADREIYALESKAAIIKANDEELKFIGSIWKFYEGMKEKVN